jgi:titin
MNGPVAAFINVTTLPPTTPTFDVREDVRNVSGSQLYIPYWSLTLNDFDPQGSAISVTAIDSAGLAGTLTCDSGGCLYKSGGSTLTRFRYTATNGRGDSDTAFVRIHLGGANNLPIAAPDTLTTSRSATLRFSNFELLRNDYDADNDPLTAIVLPANTANGTLTCDAKTYWCTYAPKLTATGSDTLTYTLSDGISNVTSTFTINITTP